MSRLLSSEIIAPFALVASGAILALAFYGYPVAGWLGLVVIAWALLKARHVFVASYLAGLLFNILALDWLSARADNFHPLVLYHIQAIGWVITAILYRRLPTPIGFAVAWTVGIGVPTWIMIAMSGPPGHFYMNRLAQTQVELSISQMADLAGMPGIEFIMALTAAAVIQRKFLIGSLATACWVLYGLFAIVEPTSFLTVDLHDEMVRLSDKCPRADLHVWPEYSCGLEWEEEHWRKLADRIGGTIISGVQNKDYNTVIVVGHEITYTSKRYLVLGNEYPSPVELLLGQTSENLKIGSPQVVDGLSIPICYEITVPAAIVGRPRIIVNPGREISIRSAGTAAMLAHARLRAIENRCPVVRAIQGGITAMIDGNGRIVKFGTGVERVGLDERQTLYATLGNWLFVLCLVASLKIMQPRAANKASTPRIAEIGKAACTSNLESPVKEPAQ